MQFHLTMSSFSLDKDSAHDHPHGKGMFSSSQSDPHLVQLCAVPALPLVHRSRASISLCLPLSGNCKAFFRLGSLSALTSPHRMCYQHIQSWHYQKIRSPLKSRGLQYTFYKANKPLVSLQITSAAITSYVARQKDNYAA